MKYAPLIGILILVLILFAVDLGQVIDSFSGADIWLILFSSVISLLAFLVMAYRWHLIIKSLGINYSLRDSIKSVLKGASLGAFTPGKVGELYKVKYLMKTCKKPGGLCFSTVIIDRLMDVFMLLLLGLVCSIFFAQLYVVELPIQLFAVIIILFIGACFLLINESILNMILLPLVRFIVPKKAEGMSFHFREFQKGLKNMKVSALVAGFSLTFLLWFLHIVGLHMRIMAFGINTDFSFAFLVLPIITLINLLPVSFSGLGTSQASFIFLFSFAAISPELAVAVSFVHIVVGVWIQALPGAILYLKKL